MTDTTPFVDSDTVSTTAVPGATLTGREEDIVRALARGAANAEIGEQLYISLSTVKSHVANIQSKLGVRNRVEIAGWAWGTGRMR